MQNTATADGLIGRLVAAIRFTRPVARSLFCALAIVVGNVAAAQASKVGNLPEYSCTFVSGGDYDLGALAQGVAIGDLNGDLAADLVVTKGAQIGRAAVLLNDGSGAFARHVTYFPSIGGSVGAVTLGDFDGDFDLDVATTGMATTEPGTGFLWILLNDGSGGFPVQTTYPSMVGTPLSLATGDLDGDFDLDLAVGDRETGCVQIFSNDGSAGFTHENAYAAADFPYSVAVGDLDGDLYLDLAVTGYEDSVVSILLNQGDGTFTQPALYDTGDMPYTVSIADLDGDTALDLAVVNSGSTSVSILRNLGGGTFASQVTYPVGVDPLYIVIGDLDGDSEPDLVVSNAASMDGSVLLNAGDGTFASQLLFDLPGAPRAGLALGDLDGDLDLDLVVPLWFAAPFPNQLSILRPCLLNLR